MMMYKKYPRTPHLLWSESKSKDDISLSSMQQLQQLNEIVVTEKLDGENTTLYQDHIHARSLDSKGHPSRAWVKALHAQIQADIPAGFRLCGENVFAQHSIYYETLSSYFYLFAIFEDDPSTGTSICLSWSDTVAWSKLLDLESVPLLYQGPWDERAIKACWRGTSTFGTEQEGYVVRNAQSFGLADFSMNVAKYVRPQHVTTADHWLYQPLRRNGLRSK